MRAFIVQHAPTIALAVHRAADLGTPEHQIGQGLIEKQVRRGTDEFTREQTKKVSR